MLLPLLLIADAKAQVLETAKPHVAKLTIAADGTTQLDALPLRSDRALLAELRRYRGKGSKKRDIDIFGDAKVKPATIFHVMRIVERSQCCVLAVGYITSGRTQN
jgi:biopolymer transport protein ExbD